MIKKITENGYKLIEGGVCASKGFKAMGVQCGLAHKALNNSLNDEPKPKTHKNDLAIIFSEKRCTAGGVYTSNKVKSATIQVTKKNISDGYAQAIIVNSVNANTCNADGVEKAQMECDLGSKELGIPSYDMVVCSTGVIGQPLPIEPIRNAIPDLVKNLSYTGNLEAEKAMMTTDTMPKEIAVEFDINGKICHVGGCLKGSGMIKPNMCTTLSFFTSDVSISSDMVQKALSENVVSTLNCVSVDGDMSTNDTCIVMANGLAGNDEINMADENFEKFKKALHICMLNMARMMARDGEGANKLLTCKCTGAKDFQTAKTVAKTVIESNLVKTAIFGEDANWGRVLCAIGYSDAEFDITKVDVDMKSEFGEIAVCRNGAGVDFSEETASKVLSAEEIEVAVNLNDGSETATAWGCDLSYSYVKINSDYRS